MKILDNLMYCNERRFGGTTMLANRTIVEFAGFVSNAIFDKKSDEYKFCRTQKDIFPFKDITTKDEFVLWSELFRRSYEEEMRQKE